MIVKLLTEHNLVFLSLKGGCRSSSVSIHVKMPHCWKSYALAQYYSNNQFSDHAAYLLDHVSGLIYSDSS